MEIIISKNKKARKIKGNFLIAGTKEDILFLYGSIKSQIDQLSNSDKQGKIYVNPEEEELTDIQEW